MKILGIETSCDETAVSIVEARGTGKQPRFKILAHLISSQTAIHAPWGGVVPMLAKREHAKNLIPLLRQALKQAKLLKVSRRKNHLTLENAEKIKTILEREPELLDEFLRVLPTIKPPQLDAIAVTEGPGLEPALWVGINFAKALALAWQTPVMPINHLEGHIASVLANGITKSEARNTKQIRGFEFRNSNLRFPAVALVVSGGHTELVLVKNWLNYKIIGETRDDACGEAFDKVARLLGLPYPGGPAIARLAVSARATGRRHGFSLPRPMIDSPDFDFSFAGLKTAALYLVRKLPELTNLIRAEIAAEFEEAAIEVLVSKTMRAAREHRPKTLIVTGGVAANNRLRQAFVEALSNENRKIELRFPEKTLATDNATMIALAAYFHFLKKTKKELTGAKGNLRLGEIPR